MESISSTRVVIVRNAPTFQDRHIVGQGRLGRSGPGGGDNFWDQHYDYEFVDSVQFRYRPACTDPFDDPIWSKARLALRIPGLGCGNPTLTNRGRASRSMVQYLLEAVANYHRLGEMVYRNSTLTEVSETLNNIVEQAEVVTMQESEHWFDNVTVSRHMKQMNEAYKVFEKTSKEMTGLQQRLESAYEDMGTVLNRYYKIGESLKDSE